MKIWHHPVRVYYEDTDFSGLVYHASYLRFLERGRTEVLRDLGIIQSAAHEGETLAFVVRHMVLDFIKPARMDDLIDVETQVSDIAGASLVMRQSIFRDKICLLTADVKIAVVKDGRVSRLPAALRALLA
eukprot:gene2410-2445_t